MIYHDVMFYSNKKGTSNQQRITKIRATIVTKVQIIAKPLIFTPKQSNYVRTILLIMAIEQQLT